MLTLLCQLEGSTHLIDNSTRPFFDGLFHTKLIYSLTSSCHRSVLNDVVLVNYDILQKLYTTLKISDDTHHNKK